MASLTVWKTCPWSDRTRFLFRKMCCLPQWIHSLCASLFVISFKVSDLTLINSLSLYHWRLFRKHNQPIINFRWPHNSGWEKFSSKTLSHHQSRYAILNFACHHLKTLSQFNFFRTSSDAISFRCDSIGTNLWGILTQSQQNRANSGKQRICIVSEGQSSIRAITLILISCSFLDSYWYPSVLTDVIQKVPMWESGWGSKETTVFAILSPRRRYGRGKREGFCKVRKEDFECQSRA